MASTPSNDMLQEPVVEVPYENGDPIHKNTLKTVAVEGNIGCGKTTFLNYFKKYGIVEVVEEPLEKWKNVNGFNALDLLYKDTKRWSCAFEFLVTLSLIENHQAHKNHKGLKILERSVYSTRHCFMEHLSNMGQIHPMEQMILADCHTFLDHTEDLDLDLIVYLRSSPEVCAQRIKLRNRAEESDIPMEYLRALHQLHDDWLIHGKKGNLPAPVLVLDADKDLEDLQKDIDSHRQEIFCGLDIR